MSKQPVSLTVLVVDSEDDKTKCLILEFVDQAALDKFDKRLTSGVEKELYHDLVYVGDSEIATEYVVNTDDMIAIVYGC